MIPIENFKQAADVIAGKILRTPLIHSLELSRMFGAEIYLNWRTFKKPVLSK